MPRRKMCFATRLESSHRPTVVHGTLAQPPGMGQNGLLPLLSLDSPQHKLIISTVALLQAWPCFMPPPLLLDQHPLSTTPPL
jgi:hypothetical protein